MNGIFFTLLMFLLALTILITFHEYGHFLVARLFGVKVQRFSLGFGKVLYSWRGKKGTEWAISAVPLGGYVKMLDETEGEVSAEDRQYSFNVQSLWRRTLIVLAGPVANFLLATIIFAGIYAVGFDVPKPYLGQPLQNSQAVKAGIKANDLILAVNGTSVNSWADVHRQLIRAYGQHQALTFLVQQPDGQQLNKTFANKQWAQRIQPPHFLLGLGMTVYQPEVPPVVYKLSPGKPAIKAGLKPGDRIVAVDGKPIKNWNQFTSYIKVRPLQTVNLTVVRKKAGDEAARLKLPLSLASRQIGGQAFGYAGLQIEPFTYPEDKLYREHYPWWQAIVPGVHKTAELTGLTLAMFGKLITGKVSIRAVSGPVGIAVGAGQSARGGLSAYLVFLALISISLAVINLFPIPMLDGGHLLFYAIEAIRRKPLSPKAQMIAFKLGMLVIISIMAVAFYSDFVSFFTQT